MATKQYFQLSGIGCETPLSPTPRPVDQAAFQALLQDPSDFDFILVVDGKDAVAGCRAVRAGGPFLRATTPNWRHRRADDGDLRHSSARAMVALVRDGGWMTAEEAVQAGNPLAGRPSGETARLSLTKARQAVDVKLPSGEWESIDFEPASTAQPARYRFRPGRAAADRLGLEPVPVRWCVAWSEMVEAVPGAASPSAQGLVPAGEPQPAETQTEPATEPTPDAALRATENPAEQRAGTAVESPPWPEQHVQVWTPASQGPVPEVASVPRRPLLFEGDCRRRLVDHRAGGVRVTVRDAIVDLFHREAIVLFELSNGSKWPAQVDITLVHRDLALSLEYDASRPGPRIQWRGRVCQRVPCGRIEVGDYAHRGPETMVFGLPSFKMEDQVAALFIRVVVDDDERKKVEFFPPFRVV